MQIHCFLYRQLQNITCKIIKACSTIYSIAFTASVLKDRFERLYITLCLSQKREAHCKVEFFKKKKKEKLPAEFPFGKKSNSNLRPLYDCSCGGTSCMARQPEADLISVCPMLSALSRCTAEAGHVLGTAVPEPATGKCNLPVRPESLRILVCVGVKLQ